MNQTPEERLPLYEYASVLGRSPTRRPWRATVPIAGRHL